MGYMINRIYLENYKLFDGIKLDFGNNLLSVFDGPNGYGKTSVFDAIDEEQKGFISTAFRIHKTSKYNNI